MEYTVQKLAKLAGISPRTIRYYDEIGILKPARINSSGYRIYGLEEVNLLQQILFYREFDVNLEDIKNIITSPSYNVNTALKEHREKLLQKRKQLDLLINNIDRTIASSEGSINMSDKDKFNGFKEKMVADNEKKYGKEIREQYGEEIINKSNVKLMNMTEEQYDDFKSLEKEIMTTLAEAFKTGDPASDLAQNVAELHKKWISYSWNKYSKEAHRGLAEMYIQDERFTAYYDKEQIGMAKFLRDSIVIYTKAR